MIPLHDYNFAANMHLYRWKELNILLDVNSGAIHLLDEPLYIMLEQLIDSGGDWAEVIRIIKGRFSDQEVEELLGEVEQSWSEGALFTREPLPVFEFTQFAVKALCLNVAHICNMRCHYCFAQQGDFGQQAAVMPLETARRAIEFLIDRSGGIRNLEVDFFGGEPLLAADMLQDLVKYCRIRESETGKRFNFTLTTNAVLLDEEIMDWIIANDIAVILSIDGRKSVHDRHRILNNGQGSYDLILPKIKRMVGRQPVSYYVRGTFAAQNLDFSRDLRHLIELGFENLSLEPAVGPDDGYTIQERHLPAVLDEYERLTEVLLEYAGRGQKLHFFHYELDLQQGPCLAKRTSGCGAGVEYLVITPEGDIYPCHQFVGQQEFFMGNVHNQSLDENISRQFANNRIKDKSCKNCWARYFCGGGCHAAAYFNNGDITRPFETACTMHRKRIEGAIYLDLQKRRLKK